MTNITHLATPINPETPNMLFDEAKGLPFEKVLIVGWDQAGIISYISNIFSAAEVLLLIERLKKDIV